MNLNHISCLIAGILAINVTGCAYVTSSEKGYQPVVIKANIEKMSADKSSFFIKNLDIRDNNIDKKFEVKPGERFMVKMGEKPLGITVKESGCIKETNTSIKPRGNPFLWLNVLWGEFSTFSSSTDATNGTNWRYFPADREITANVKDTPECQEWLEKIKFSDHYIPMPNTAEAKSNDELSVNNTASEAETTDKNTTENTQNIK